VVHQLAESDRDPERPDDVACRGGNPGRAHDRSDSGEDALDLLVADSVLTGRPDVQQVRDGSGVDCNVALREELQLEQSKVATFSSSVIRSRRCIASSSWAVTQETISAPGSPSRLRHRTRSAPTTVESSSRAHKMRDVLCLDNSLPGS